MRELHFTVHQSCTHSLDADFCINQMIGQWLLFLKAWYLDEEALELQRQRLRTVARNSPSPTGLLGFALNPFSVKLTREQSLQWKLVTRGHRSLPHDLDAGFDYLWGEATSVTETLDVNHFTSFQRKMALP